MFMSPCTDWNWDSTAGSVTVHPIVWSEHACNFFLMTLPQTTGIFYRTFYILYISVICCYCDFIWLFMVFVLTGTLLCVTWWMSCSLLCHLTPPRLCCLRSLMTSPFGETQWSVLARKNLYTFPKNRISGLIFPRSAWPVMVTGAIRNTLLQRYRRVNLWTDLKTTKRWNKKVSSTAHIHIPDVLLLKKSEVWLVSAVSYSAVFKKNIYFMYKV